MTGILTDMTESALRYACRQNLYQLSWSLRDYWKGAVFEEHEKMLRWYTPVPIAFIFNAVITKRPPRQNESDLIQETIHFFSNRDRATFAWWQDEDQQANLWGPQLEPFGFKQDDHLPGMAAVISDLPEAVQLPEGIRLAIVQDEAEIEVWTHTFCDGYGLPAEWEASCVDMMKASLRAGMVCYLAWDGAEPVATSAVFYCEGVAGIYNVATRAAWRGRGLGTALTLQPLADAHRRGYRAAILQASEMGYPIYQRLGFKEVCRMLYYVWEAPDGDAK